MPSTTASTPGRCKRPGGEKGTGTICAKHPPGRSGKWCLSPFSHPSGHCDWASCPPISVSTRWGSSSSGSWRTSTGASAKPSATPTGTPDGVTARLQAAAALWRDAFGLSDEQLAEQVRADRIDVLFDLAGHTADNRLLVFARKPAPIQVTWCGYAGTTGLAAMDYILADRHTIPPGSERYYCERVLWMPDGFLCFDPPEAAPPVRPCRRWTTDTRPLPVSTTRQNHLSGRGGLGRILERLPGSRLVLKYRGMDDPSRRGGCRTSSPPGGPIRPGWSFAASRPIRRGSRTTIGSTWRWTPFPTTAAPRPARRCGWACRW